MYKFYLFLEIQYIYDTTTNFLEIFELLKFFTFTKLSYSKFVLGNYLKVHEKLLFTGKVLYFFKLLYNLFTKQN